MTQKLTTEKLQDIYEAAVHVEATLGDPDAEFDLYCKLDDVGGVDVTIRKLIDMVRAASREAQPVAWGYEWASCITCDGPQNFKHVIEREAPPKWAIDEGQARNVTPLFTAPPAPAVQKEVEAIIGLLESGDWAEHCKKSELGQRLESAVTALVGSDRPAPVVNPEFTDAPAVPDVDDIALETSRAIMHDVDRRTDLTGGACQLQAKIQCHIENACRAAMLAQPVRRGYKLNSPETPDGWKLVPIELTAEMAQAARDAHEGEVYLPYSIYRAMLSVSPLPPTNPDGWIACSERMPEYGKDVQVYCSDTKEQFVGFHIGKGYFQFAKDELGNKIVCNQTHWMPLPAPEASSD